MILLICLLFAVSFGLLYLGFTEKIHRLAIHECELHCVNDRLQHELSVKSGQMLDASHWHNVCADNLRFSRAENELLTARITQYNNVVDELNDKLEKVNLLLEINRDMVAERDAQLLMAYEDCQHFKMRLRYYEQDV